VIATATNALAAGDLFTNQAALPPRWRPNAKWMMNLGILNGYRQLAQASGLNFSIVNDGAIANGGAAAAQPMILGWPVYENGSMDGTLGTGNDYTVLSGDSSRSWTGSAQLLRECRISSARIAGRPDSGGS